jgi:hypothetical protein
MSVCEGHNRQLHTCNLLQCLLRMTSLAIGGRLAWSIRQLYQRAGPWNTASLFCNIRFSWTTHFRESCLSHGINMFVSGLMLCRSRQSSPRQKSIQASPKPSSQDSFYKVPDPSSMRPEPSSIRPDLMPVWNSTVERKGTAILDTYAWQVRKCCQFKEMCLVLACLSDCYCLHRWKRITWPRSWTKSKVFFRRLSSCGKNSSTHA